MATHLRPTALVLLALMTAAPAAGQDLRSLSIEELMRIDVTTTSRRAEPIGTAAAAISVITGEDIRRSGITTIADALLLADGVHVARFNNGSWAVTPRGFNGSTPNKLLVMVDGRTVYSPLFSGVFWNTLDYVLEDLDRIEVIRGPGAALWGANAVNGVVNIITKHSRDTQGSLVTLSSGNEDPGILEARYGGQAGTDTTWRAYGKLALRDQQSFSTGGPSGDSRRRGQVGFRIDAGEPAATSWLIKGDAFHSRDDLPDRPQGEFTELSLQGRWSTAVRAASRLSLQSYYRREYRRVPRQLTHHIDVFDFDAQYSTTLYGRHTVVTGAGARINRDNTYGSAVLRFDPGQRTYPVFNAFVQDDMAVSTRLSVIAGVKVEHNAFSGAELQPNLRARLLLPSGQVLWGAISRAVRRPTRFDDDLEVLAPGGVVVIRGSGEFESEVLDAAEIGYRVQPLPAVSLDATLFVHRYTGVRSQDAQASGLPPFVIGNSLDGQSHGIELAVNYRPLTWWRTHVGYTWLDTSIERILGSRDISAGVNETNDPEHLFGLRTSLDLPRDVELDAMLRAVSALPNPAVPAYTELSFRAGWLVTPTTDLWFAAQDVLHDAHPEFGSTVPRRVEFERAVRAGLTLRF